MKRRRLIGLLGGLCVIVLWLGSGMHAADPAKKLAQAGPELGAAGEDPLMPIATEPDKDSQELLQTLRRLELQSAELYLRLTEIDLQKIANMNDKVAGIYSASEVDNFKAAVGSARERVAAARDRAEGKNVSAIVGTASVRLKTAEQAYDRALNANRQRPDTVIPLDIDRLKLAVDSARVDLEKAKVVLRIGSPLMVTRFELDELREEVRQLRFRITSITARR